MAGQRLSQRARDEPAGELPRRPRRRRHRRVRRDVAHGRRGAHHDVRHRSGLAPAAHRRAAAARVRGRRDPAPGARDDAGGPPLEPAGPPAVREVRVPAGRRAAALLQRRPRGRADHDHAAAVGCRRWSSASNACGSRSRTPRRRCAPTRPPRERSADPVDRVVVRRDRHRGHRRRPADRLERRRLAGRDARRLRRDRPRGRGPRPPALDRARAGRGVGRTRASSGRTCRGSR